MSRHFLAGYRGYIHADGYAGYNPLYTAARWGSSGAARGHSGPGCGRSWHTGCATTSAGRNTGRPPPATATSCASSTNSPRARVVRGLFPRRPLRAVGRGGPHHPPLAATRTGACCQTVRPGSPYTRQSGRSVEGSDTSENSLAERARSGKEGRQVALLAFSASARRFPFAS